MSDVLNLLLMIVALWAFIRWLSHSGKPRAMREYERGQRPTPQHIAPHARRPPARRHTATLSWPAALAYISGAIIAAVLRQRDEALAAWRQGWRAYRAQPASQPQIAAVPPAHAALLSSSLTDVPPATPVLPVEPGGNQSGNREPEREPAADEDLPLLSSKRKAAIRAVLAAGVTAGQLADAIGGRRQTTLALIRQVVDEAAGESRAATLRSVTRMES